MPDAKVFEDAERHPELSGTPAPVLHALYLARFEGFEGLDHVHRTTTAPDVDQPLIDVTKDALTSAFIDLRQLALAVAEQRYVGRETPPEEVDGATLSKLDEAEGLAGSHVLVELYHRVRQGWDAVATEIRSEVVADLRMLAIDVETDSPQWADVLALLDEIASLDHDGGKGDKVVGNADALVRRFEAAGAEPESLRPAKTTPTGDGGKREVPQALLDALFGGGGGGRDDDDDDAGEPDDDLDGDLGGGDDDLGGLGALLGGLRGGSRREPPPEEIDDGSPPTFEVLVERLLAALVSKELLALTRRGRVADLADGFLRALEKGEVYRLSQLDDWLLDQDGVDDLFFDKEQLVSVAQEIGLPSDAM